MADLSSDPKPSDPKKEQIERAQRLHEKIERLKQGQPAPKDAEQGTSLREEIESRAAEQKKPITRDS